MLLKSETLSFKCALILQKDLKIVAMKMNIGYPGTDDSEKAMVKFKQVCEVYNNSVVIKESNEEIIAPFQFANLKIAIVNFAPNEYNLVNSLCTMVAKYIHYIEFISDDVVVYNYVRKDI